MANLCDSGSEEYTSTVKIATAVRGYHVFMSTWTPTVGDKFVCIHEENNTHDTHAMGAYDDKKLVGHLPKEASRYFHFFTLHNGPEISGEVTGKRRHCSEAGGMEIPCILTLEGSKRTIEKLKQLIKGLNSSSIVIQ